MNPENDTFFLNENCEMKSSFINRKNKILLFNYYNDVSVPILRLRFYKIGENQLQFIK